MLIPSKEEKRKYQDVHSRIKLTDFLTKYNPSYMQDKQWEDEVLREDTPTLNVMVAELGRTAIVNWIMVQVAALNNLGNHFKMDDYQVQHTAELILTRYARMTVAQTIAFFQWYATEGDDRRSVDALQILRSFATYKEAINKERQGKAKDAGQQAPFAWIEDGYTMSIADVKRMTDDEINACFAALPRDKGVCVRSGDAYMITGEYLARTYGEASRMAGWEERVNRYRAEA